MCFHISKSLRVKISAFLAENEKKNKNENSGQNENGWNQKIVIFGATNKNEFRSVSKLRCFLIIICMPFRLLEWENNYENSREWVSILLVHTATGYTSTLSWGMYMRLSWTYCGQLSLVSSMENKHGRSLISGLRADTSVRFFPFLRPLSVPPLPVPTYLFPSFPFLSLRTPFLNLFPCHPISSPFLPSLD